MAKFPNPFNAIILMAGTEMVPPMMVMLWKMLMVEEIGHLVITKRCFSVLNEVLIAVLVASSLVIISMASRWEFLASVCGSASMKSFQVEGGWGAMAESDMVMGWWCVWDACNGGA